MDDLYKKVHERFAAYHDPAHDELHVLRVSKLAKQLARAEQYDKDEAEIAGLLHDIGRTIKGRTEPHAHAGVPLAKELLDAYTNFSDEAKERILIAIEHHSDLHTTGKLNNILQDADKLDGLGALGVSRAYTSLPDAPSYDPTNIFPKEVVYGQYTTAHDVFGQVLKWYDMLYTKKAKEIGKPRYEFMQGFMKQVLKEINESR